MVTFYLQFKHHRDQNCYNKKQTHYFFSKSLIIKPKTKKSFHQQCKVIKITTICLLIGKGINWKNVNAIKSDPNNFYITTSKRCLCLVIRKTWQSCCYLWYCCTAIWASEPESINSFNQTHTFPTNRIWNRKYEIREKYIDKKVY